ncbi:VOC family protein [Streptomyces sp. NPDC050255]|uniref:VOC family protein n=1 Tax=Streptomyces sp. NPDC050255 TaxID=3365606 RepID=UPI0037B2071D
MPPRLSYGEGTACWVDHAGVDLTGTKDFYGPLLDWEFRSEGGRGYHLILRGGQIVGGLGPSPMGPGYGSSWTVYLAAKDLALSQRRAEEHGARFTVSAVSVGANGRFSLGTDPHGGAFGLWEGHRDEGVVLVDEPGALVDAVLHGAHPGDQGAFYRSVCGATVTQEASRTTRWVPCFGVADRAAFELRARGAGAEVLAPGLFSDPWGSVFGVRNVAVGSSGT